MSNAQLSDGEPLRKRQKVSDSVVVRPSPAASVRSPHISRYIPAGCLRLIRSQCSISNELWKSCNEWRTLWHPADLSYDDSHLQNALQQRILESSNLQPYISLHKEAWIRMEFRTNGQHLGQIRIYILPDDVGRGLVARTRNSLRKDMRRLLTEIDVADSTWDGEWLEETPVVHLDSSLDKKEEDQASLFYLFNTLPSPKPNPEIVVNNLARNAIYALLDSNVEGLATTMHQYQRRSAALMLQRESQPSQVFDPRMRPVLDQSGVIWYCDFEEATCLREPRKYENSTGGILAETMGLGKTLICLALILATKDISSQIPVEFSVGTIPVRQQTGSLKEMAAAAVGRTGAPWKSYFAAFEEDGYDYSQCKEAIKRYPGHYFIPGPVPRRQSRNPAPKQARKVFLTTATLVVVPSNLVKQWELEIKKHTTGLKVLVMTKLKQRLPPAQELIDYDLILFSKQRFDMEAIDGFDKMGRSKSTTFNVCNCPYIGATRERDCTCFKVEDTYQSPMKQLHFKRLITDEGHSFGNSSRTARTEATTVVDFLQVSARWIVSGTPTRGLYGAEVSLGSSRSSSNTPLPSNGSLDSDGLLGKVTKSLATLKGLEPLPADINEQEMAFYKEERKDLEKLGNIAAVYLKAKPWSNTYEDGDYASWSQYVLQPRHGSKSHGNMDCLRSTLEGMIIRHRPEDVERDVVLPPLHQSVVKLEGSLQDKLSLNIFSMMIVSNAVTSERKDADYLFHPRQRKALNQLVSNLRQASFHWSGYTTEDVQVTVDLAKRFLEKGEVPVTSEDETLLKEAIHIGECVLSNNLKKQISSWHEMPIYIQNEWPADLRTAWSLDGGSENPTLMGASMLHSAQKLVGSQLWKEDSMEGLLEAGKRTLRVALEAANASLEPRIADKKNSRSSKKSDAPPVLAGGVSVLAEGSKKKQQRDGSHIASSLHKKSEVRDLGFVAKQQVLDSADEGLLTDLQSPSKTKPKSALKKAKPDIAGILDPSSPLASTVMVSTSSAKLSYLMDKIVIHHEKEKILVFYESENVAYYIAQALECLQIKHLIYAKSLPSARKAQYVVTFNQTETFRVLIMDISQAAFGLDMSSASRVFFVNPVFSPQVEAQAVKRAHRIGQTKPVFVETLVLQGSIEEVILDRRSDLTNEEHNKCKNILDDERMYDWIRNVRFLPIPESRKFGPEQMAKLETPQSVFQRNANAQLGAVQHPDADLISDGFSPKGKRKANVSFDLKEQSLPKNKKGKVLVPLAENAVHSHVSFGDNSGLSSPSATPFNEDEVSPFTGFNNRKIKDNQYGLCEKALGNRNADSAGIAGSSLSGNAVTPPPKTALYEAVSPYGSVGKSATYTGSGGERSGFFSNRAGHAREISAQLQPPSPSQLSATSAGLVGEDDEI